MSNYSPSTISRVGDLNPKRGIVCRTSVVANTSVFLATAVNIFKITGKIRIVSLDYEAITEFSATSSVPRWQFVSTTPAVALTNISAASADNTGMALGTRVVFQGTALNTAPEIDAAIGITPKPANMMDVGSEGGVLHLALDSDVAQTSGTSVFTLCYLPLTSGAAAEALF
jgi:hypothetical protein